MQMDEQKSSAGHQLNVPSGVYSTMKGRNFWIALWMVMRPGFLTATLKWKSNPWCGSIVVHQNKENQTNVPWQKANGYCFMGQKRCFSAGGIHESRSNSHIGSVLWDVKTIKEGDLKQRAWPTNFGCRVVAWQRDPALLCAKSICSGNSSGNCWPSAVQSGPDPFHFHMFLHLTTFLALQNLMDDKVLKSAVENWLNTLPSMMRGCKSRCPTVISASILAVKM